MTESLIIGGREVGQGHPCYVIAEIGTNHNGSFEQALDICKKAIATGVDAVKFQTFKAEDLWSKEGGEVPHIAASGATMNIVDLVRSFELNDEEFAELARLCDSAGVQFLSTPLGAPAVDRVAKLAPAIKIASMDLNNPLILRKAASIGKPIVLSTGMGDLGKVDRALKWIGEAGNPPVALLHCVSSYPPEDAATNLRAIDTLRSAFGLPTGFSDHSADSLMSLAAVARGACIVEKHFTVDRSLPGGDHQISLEPDQMADMVRSIRRIEAALGSGIKHPSDREVELTAVFYRSLIVRRFIAEGETIEADDLDAVRPAKGISPEFADLIIGRKARTDMAPDTILKWEMF